MSAATAAVIMFFLTAFALKYFIDKAKKKDVALPVEAPKPEPKKLNDFDTLINNLEPKELQSIQVNVQQTSTQHDDQHDDQHSGHNQEHEHKDQQTTKDHQQNSGKTTENQGFDLKTAVISANILERKKL